VPWPSRQLATLRKGQLGLPASRQVEIEDASRSGRDGWGWLELVASAGKALVVSN
jgi:hypothetical protein